MERRARLMADHVAPIVAMGEAALVCDPLRAEGVAAPTASCCGAGLHRCGGSF
jgi:hypothetical protein